jgi:hypothetical protein
VDIRWLQDFLALSDLHNFTRAAADLRLSPAARTQPQDCARLELAAIADKLRADSPLSRQMPYADYTRAIPLYALRTTAHDFAHIKKMDHTQLRFAPPRRWANTITEDVLIIHCLSQLRPEANPLSQNG